MLDFKIREVISDSMCPAARSFFTPKIAQVVRLRAAARLIPCVVNIAASAIRDKISKRPIGEIENKAAAHIKELLKSAFFHVAKLDHARQIKS